MTAGQPRVKEMTRASRLGEEDKTKSARVRTARRGEKSAGEKNPKKSFLGVAATV